MDFDLNLPVDAIDKVPEQFRPLYAPAQDGKFVVDEKYKGVKEAITGLNTSLRASRDDAKKRTPTDLTPLAEFGTDPVAIKAEFDRRVSDLVAKGGDAAKAVERVRTEMAAANAAALSAANAKTSAYQTQLYTMLVKNDALSSIAEAKGVPELLMPFIEKQVKVMEEDGRFVVHVMDDKGERRYSGVTGQPMTIKELVTGMKADAKYARLFDSEKQGGGGMLPGGGTRQPPASGTTKTANDKINAGLSSRLRGGR